MSLSGTTGACHQKVLAFTIAGRKAPDRLFRGFLSSCRVRLRLQARYRLLLQATYARSPAP